jgi:PTH1 family peptidyl-tRNA hydrolase
MGFLVVEELARRKGLTFARNPGEPWEGTLWEGEVWLVKPLSYMNLSGEVVARCLAKWDLTPSMILVVVDDWNLPLGRIRLRAQGSAGGHRGLESVEKALGTRAYGRLRCGIGPMPEGIPARDFVLSRFAPEELPMVHATVQRAVEALECARQKGLAVAMSLFNSGPGDSLRGR